MTPEESNLINGLFDRLEQSQNQPMDPEAERLIRNRVSSSPNAAYLLTQSTLVLQQAVTAAQSRIADLEKQQLQAAPQNTGGSFLSGVARLFDAPQPATTVTRPSPPPLPQQTAPQGGGFLKNALATAAGVAGGAMLFQGIESLLGHNPGPFGGMGIPSGAFPGENQPTEVINNYYEEPGSVDTSGAGSNLPDQDEFADTADSFGQNDDFFDGGDDSSFT